MAKAARTKAKRKPKPKFTDKAQSERFVETACAMGAERTDNFDEVLKKVVRYKQKQPS